MPNATVSPLSTNELLPVVNIFRPVFTHGNLFFSGTLHVRYIVQYEVQSSLFSPTLHPESSDEWNI